MIFLKPLLLVILTFLTGFNSQVSKPYVAKWVINKECFLRVAGSTNVNKFSCVVANYYNSDTLIVYKNSEVSVKMIGALTIDIRNFNCHNPIMTKDLQTTLKIKEFPKLVIRFLSLSRYPDFNSSDVPITGLVSIELAGVTKRFTINYRFNTTGANSLTLIGAKAINFSDFNIVPPRKLGGMIQTNNELNIEFNLNVKVLD